MAQESKETCIDCLNICSRQDFDAIWLLNMVFYVLFSLFLSPHKLVSWDLDCPLLAKKNKNLCIF